MISSIVWVPVGVADPSPKRYEMNAKELEILRMLEEQEGQGGGGMDNTNDKRKKSRGLEVKALSSSTATAAAITSTAPADSAADLPADLRMDEYSSDEDEGAAVGRLLVAQSGMIDELAAENDDEDGDDSEEDDDEDEKVGMNDEGDEESDDEDELEDVPDTREYEPIDVEGLQSMGLNQIGNSAMHMEGLGEDEDDDSEAENVQLTDDDAIVLVAKTEDDFAAIEVNVYDQKTGNLYVHHDIPLPSFPLCLAHGRVGGTGTLGNFCAVGTFGPGIEIWNLDVLNALEPSCVLGGEDTTASDELMKMEVLGGKMPANSRRGKESVSLRPGSHTDAVMALSWNPIHQQVIASGSADKTVKLWDVTKADSEMDKCNAATFRHHRDKVQAVEWHPKESTLLATGSFDRTVALLDARTNGQDVKRVKIQSDCEALAWDPFHPELLTVVSEDGSLSCWDVRKFETSTPAWSIVPSEFGGLNNLTYNPNIPGMLATCSVDKTVTLWDTYQGGTLAENAPPKPCMTKDMCAGKLYTVKFYPSSPWLIGCGGSGGQISLWHLDSEARLKQRFSGREAGAVDAPVEEERQAEQDFEAMMAEKDNTKVGAPTNNGDASKSKKKSGSSKKKAHKRNRR